MPRSQINIDVETALVKIKKDIVRAGGSCMLIVVNDGEMMNHGGGDADRIRLILSLLLDEIDRNPGAMDGNLVLPPS